MDTNCKHSQRLIWRGDETDKHCTHCERPQPGCDCVGCGWCDVDISNGPRWAIGGDFDFFCSLACLDKARKRWVMPDLPVTEEIQ